MTIHLSAEQERAIQAAIKSGFVRSVDEFIDVAIAMLPSNELLMGNQEFFAGRSLSELAQIQGIKPLDDPSVLIGGWPPDENLDEFLENTYKERNASVIRSPNGSSPA